MGSLIRAAFSLTSTRVCIGLATAVAGAMCAVPLLAVHGPESALALGILLPPMAAWMAASVTAHARAAGGVKRTGELLEAALLPALCLLLLPLLVLYVDALRVRNCAPLEGLAFMLLGPGFGVILASLVGVWAGLVLQGRRMATVGALGVPLLGIALALGRFYATPAIFSYGHFFGFFSGTVYDEDVSIGAALLSLRAASSAWIAGLSLLVTSCTDPVAVRLSLAVLRTRAFGFAVAVSLCALGLVSDGLAPELGHATSVEHVRHALGGELASKRCNLVFPREWSRPDRERLAADCDFRVVQAEQWLGLRHPGRIWVFLFRTPDEKSALMGAANTNIAKPWRGEVYISETSWPNPVLGHELVHVVAAGMGTGPFRISGRLGGLLPEASLIEGVAVAAAWQAQAGLTPHQWARAMLELGMMPRLDQLFGAGFLAQQKRLAYTLSGSLLRFVAERYGKAAVRRAYTRGDLGAAVSLSLPELQTQWHSYLRSLPLSARALGLARARFAGASIFSTVCPHALAQLKTALSSDLSAGDDPSAAQDCQQILGIDPADGATRAALVGVLARLGEGLHAQRELGFMVGPPGVPEPFIALAQQALADAAFRRGDLSRAGTLYDALLAQPADDDTRRLLQVKALAVHGTPTQARLLFELLVGEPGERSDGATAVHLAYALRSERSDGLPHYLEARQLYFQHRFEPAAQLLQEARARGLPTQELALEALRVQANSRFATGDLPGAQALFQQLGIGDDPGRLAEAEDWLARIRFTQGQRAEP
jgi:hypothetical protein